MTLVSFFGCTFIAFGPAFALFVVTVAKDAQQVIVLITSAFFWLLSLLLSSILWRVVTPLQDVLVFSVMFSVVFQELFRFAFWKVLKRAEEGLITISGSQSPLRKYRFNYVAGLGFGVMSGLFAMVNILADFTGPGTVGLTGEYDMFVLVSSLLTNCFILLHTFWGVIFCEGLEKKKWLNVCMVVGSHLLVSGLTLLNKRVMYWPSLIVGHCLVVITGVWAFHVVGGSVGNFKRALKRESVESS